MLEASVEEVGAGRSLVADKHGRVVAGNKTQEVLIQAGMENAIIVHSDGTRPIIHVRDDWDLEDEDPNNPARRYAYWDNRTSEVGFMLDEHQVAMAIKDGFDFSALYHDGELENILGLAAAVQADVLVEGRQLDPRQGWPMLNIQVSPETMELYESLREQIDVRDDALALELMLGAVDASLLDKHWRKAD